MQNQTNQMKHLTLLLTPLLLLSLSCNTNKNTTEKNTQNWVALFNGKNLDNWIPKIAGYKLGENFGNTFRVENGILSTRYDAYDNFKNRFGALYYNKKFSNFRLRVEYRFVGDTVAGAPSWGYQDGGIQYYCQAPQTMDINQPFPVCLEYNLLGTRPSGEICANGIYVLVGGKRNEDYCTPPVVQVVPPKDQWSTAEIDVRNGKMTQYVNGVPVISFSNPRYDSTKAIAKQFITPGNDMVQDGYISLQSNSHPMDFRKIEIMEY
jgi:hypothetical protein